MRAISAALLLAAAAWGGDGSLLDGIAAFERGDYATAGTLLARAVEAAPGDARALTFLALTRAATGGCEQAAPELRAQSANNGDADLRRLAGLAAAQCELAAGRFAEAIAIVEPLARAFPGDANVLYEAAKIYRQGWDDAVLRMFRKTPASFRVNELSGEIFETQNRYEEAAGEYRKAIAKNPSVLNLHYRLGRALLLASHGEAALEEARREFDAELRLNPSDAAAHYQIGQILLAQQKAPEAAMQFASAVSLSPRFAEALVALARSRIQAKNYAEAIALLERAVAVQPDLEAAHYSLMIAFRDAGRAADAQRERKELDRLQRPPEGEFTEFLKKLDGKEVRP